MVTTIGVRKTVKNFNDLQTLFNLTKTEDDNFFTYFTRLNKTKTTSNISIFTFFRTWFNTN